MLLVAIAWLYVVLMVAVVEATSRNGTVFGAIVTVLLYGLLPIGLLAYLFFSPARRRARRAASAADAATREAGTATEFETGMKADGNTGADFDTEIDPGTGTGTGIDTGADAVSAPVDVAAVSRLDPDGGGHAAGVSFAPKRKEP